MYRLRWAFWRGSALLVGLVLIGILVAWAPRPSAADPQVIAVQIKKIRNGERILITNGSAEKFGDDYDVSSKVFRLPCPGHYRFDAESEDLRTGGLATYSAEMVLSDFSSWPLDLRCGLPVPAVGGSASLVLSGGKSTNPLSLSGHRGGYGNFIGDLQLSGFPSCEVSYELRSSFSLQNWNRSFTYEARFQQARLLYPGNVSAPPGCE